MGALKSLVVELERAACTRTKVIFSASSTRANRTLEKRATLWSPSSAMTLEIAATSAAEIAASTTEVTA